MSLRRQSRNVSFHSRALLAIAPALLAFGCSSPAGGGGSGDDDEEDDDDSVQEYQGPSASVGNLQGGASAGTGTGATGNGGSTGSPAPGSAQGGNGGLGGGQGTGGSVAIAPGASNGGTGGTSNTASAGSANSGVAGSNNVGNAGSTFEPPGEDTPVTPVTPVPANTNCPDLFFCDGFEGLAAGTSPQAPLWQIIESYGTAEQSENVQVSTAQARSGTSSVRVVGAQSRNGMVARLPQNRYFMRAWLRIDSAPVGPAFIGLGTDQNSETRLRVQSQSRATINTVGPGDAVRPPGANGPDCPGCVTLVPNEWFCAEFFIDNATQAATLWIDEVEAASIVNGELGWPVQPASPSLFIGSMGIQGGSSGVFIDDVAAGPDRIGCD